MKILLIGGTGTISSAITRLPCAASRPWSVSITPSACLSTSMSSSDVRSQTTKSVR